MSPIIVCNSNWGATSLSAIRGVLESVHQVLTEPFGTVPAEPIRVLPWDSPRPTVVEDRRPYQVFLTARNRYWSWYSFEFAQLLCRILTNYDNCKGHKHKWLDETLCQLASLFALHRLTDSWVVNPPATVPMASEFAPYHREYVERIERQYSPPSPQCLPEWLHQRIGSLESDPGGRTVTMTLAVALLPAFRNDPTLWVDCGVLNKWDANNDRDFAAFLDSWSTYLHEQGIGPRTPDFLRSLLVREPVELGLAAMSVPDRGPDGRT